MRYATMLAFGSLLLAAAAASAVEVKLQVSQQPAVARQGAVITSGVPFARGAVKDVSKLTVSVAGKPLAAQWAATVPWDDGSVRWALLDTQVDVPETGSVELVVTDGGGNVAPADPVRVADEADAVRLSTGGLQLVLGRNQPGLFRSLTVDGKELLTSAGQGLVVVTEDGKQVAAAAPTEIKVEQAGPMRAVVCLRGRFPGLHDELLGYTVRVTALAGQKYLKVHAWLENDGADGQGNVKPQWFAFDGMALDLGLGLGGELTARCEGVQAKGQMTVLQLCRKGDKPPHFTFDNLQYTVTGKGEQLKQGARTDGVFEVAGEGGRLTAAVRHFWQNYEKAIELDGSHLRLWLWPLEGQWPRPTRNLTHEQIRRLKNIARDKLYLLPGSVHKGHEMILDFSGRPADQSAADLSAPLFARASAEYYAATGALPAMFVPPGVKTPDKEANFKLAAWAWMSRSLADASVASSLVAARREYCEYSIGYFNDSSQWHGWMDFGDLSVPGKGQVSLHYDWLLLTAMEYLRNGDAVSLELATTMARHRIDIDQYWSDRDPAEVNGIQSGSVWPAFHANGRSGGPSPGGTWIAGPVLWYMLTGEPKAREACLRSARGLADAWAKIADSNAYGGGLKVDMDSNGWAIESFCAAWDLTGDRKWLDQALGLFRTNVTAKWKSLGPHLHSAGNQIVGQSYVKEDEAYCYVIGPLCELHRQSGDAEVLKLLTAGCEKDFPESYYAAPMYLSGLFAYVGLVSDKPDYLKKATDLFVQGFPESRRPTVFQPDNTTWSSRSAMMLRSGYPLAYAFWKKQQERGQP